MTIEHVSDCCKSGYIAYEDTGNYLCNRCDKVCMLVLLNPKNPDEYRAVDPPQQKEPETWAGWLEVPWAAHVIMNADTEHDAQKMLEQVIAAARTEVDKGKPAHMCRDGHTQIWHNDSESEICPLEQAVYEAEKRGWNAVIEKVLKQAGDIRSLVCYRNTGECEHCGALMVCEILESLKKS